MRRELSYLATAANDVFNCRYGVADTMRIRTQDDPSLHSHVEVYADQHNFSFDGPYVVHGPLGTGRHHRDAGGCNLFPLALYMSLIQSLP